MAGGSILLHDSVKEASQGSSAAGGSTTGAEASSRPAVAAEMGILLRSWRGEVKVSLNRGASLQQAVLLGIAQQPVLAPSRNLVSSCASANSYNPSGMKAHDQPTPITHIPYTCQTSMLHRSPTWHFKFIQLPHGIKLLLPSQQKDDCNLIRLAHPCRKLALILEAHPKPAVPQPAPAGSSDMEVGGHRQVSLKGCMYTYIRIIYIYIHVSLSLSL